MKKIIFVILLFGVLTYCFAAKIGTGLEWEAHDVRAVIYDTVKGEVLNVKEFYAVKMFQAR
ncbi:MAG: hypothetical protein GY754_04235, partial [bacterium]|nr:hypothetical protein [bacterium]